MISLSDLENKIKQQEQLNLILLKIIVTAVELPEPPKPWSASDDPGYEQVLLNPSFWYYGIDSWVYD
jgi:hypothetical protein